MLSGLDPKLGQTFSLLVSSAFVNICVFILHLWLLAGCFIFGYWTVWCTIPLHTKELKGLCWVSLRPVAALWHIFEPVLLHVLPPKIKHIPVTMRREIPVSCPLVVGNVTVLYCPHSSNFQYIILGAATAYPSHWACKYLYFLVQSWANPVSKQPGRALWHLPLKAGASVSLLDTQDMHSSASFALLSAAKSVLLTPSWCSCFLLEPSFMPTCAAA